MRRYAQSLTQLLQRVKPAQAHRGPVAAQLPAGARVPLGVDRTSP